MAGDDLSPGLKHAGPTVVLDVPQVKALLGSAPGRDHRLMAHRRPVGQVRDRYPLPFGNGAGSPHDTLEQMFDWRQNLL
jgi:hypothetical protein